MAGGKTSIRVVVDNVSLRDRTTQVLRDAILNLHFKPGEKLVERKLCDETGVSRTSVREALRHLESEGLVMRVGNRGMHVAEVGPDEARQIYEVRAALEPVMARLFVERAGSKQVAALGAVIGRIEKAIAAKQVLPYVQALASFTHALADGAQNKVALQLLDTLAARITFLRVVTARAASDSREHETIDVLKGIHAAIVARDADLAASRQAAYVERSAQFAYQVLAELKAASDQSSS